MKRFSLLCLLVMTGYAYASSGFDYASAQFPETDVLTGNKTITYTCTAYTKNQVFADKSTTDNPPVKAKTKIVQNAMGFDIRAGAVFPYVKKLTNAQAGSASGMAGDKTTLLVKKDDTRQVPYFIIYQFKESHIKNDGKTIEPGAIDTLIVLAGCTHD